VGLSSPGATIDKNVRNCVHELGCAI
jgi:hypothetical protein